MGVVRAEYFARRGGRALFGRVRSLVGRDDRDRRLLAQTGCSGGSVRLKPDVRSAAAGSLQVRYFHVVPGGHGPFTRGLVIAGESSYSAGTANCEKSSFFARNSDRRERTTRPFVVNYRRELTRDERDRAPRAAPGDLEVARSPLRAHTASALWCPKGRWPEPSLLPHLRALR
jgi:hypothetical protein